MKQPIFEHGGESERRWKGIWERSSTTFLHDLQDAHFRSFADLLDHHAELETGRTIYAIARELERRQIAAELASRQPKWIEQRFDDIQHHRTTEDYPGQMGSRLRPGMAGTNG